MRIFAAEKNKDIINLLFIIYMNKTKTTPDYLFESSWEVCNKVGGIYTVLSTKAHTLQQIFKDKVILLDRISGKQQQRQILKKTRNFLPIGSNMLHKTKGCM